MALTLDSQSVDTSLAISPIVPVEKLTTRVSLVVPARNEARNIATVLTGIPDCVDEVILVDGNSSDATVAMATLCRPDIRVVGQDVPGKGAALRAGFLAATGDVIVMIDADGSMSAEEIPHFLWYLEPRIRSGQGISICLGGWVERYHRLAPGWQPGLARDGQCPLRRPIDRPLLRVLCLSPLLAGEPRPQGHRFRDRDRDHHPGPASRPTRHRGAELRAAAAKRSIRAANLPRRLAGAADRGPAPLDRRRAQHPVHPRAAGCIHRHAQRVMVAVEAPRPAVASRCAAEGVPIDVDDIEMDAVLPSLPAAEHPLRCRWVLALVRVHSHPVGTVRLQVGPSGLPAPALSRLIHDELGPEIAGHLRRDGLAGLDLPADRPPRCLDRRFELLKAAPLVSVVVATRDRTTSLARCLDSVLASDYPSLRGRRRRQRSHFGRNRGPGRIALRRSQCPVRA